MTLRKARHNLYRDTSKFIATEMYWWYLQCDYSASLIIVTITRDYFSFHFAMLFYDLH